MPLPDFTSPTIFPPFTLLPLTTSSSPPLSSSASSSEEEYYLLGQITENMTLTKPTLILTDRSSTSFALVYDSRSSAEEGGPDSPFFARLGFKRGSTLVIPHAKRTPPKEDSGGRGQGFVAVQREQEAIVRVIPGGLETVVRVGAWLRGRESRRDNGIGEEMMCCCESCGETPKRGDGGGAGLMMKKCTGCGEVAYCSKVSSSISSHKADGDCCALGVP
jgi:hypothetical protein